MALTVNSAFQSFLTNSVRLDPGETTIARKSRDWLKGQIENIGNENYAFPYLWGEFNLDYGSFARRTKIIAIDDIDMMIGLHAEGCIYARLHTNPGSYEIITKPDTRLNTFSDKSILNSRKIINKFVSELSGIPQYQNADIKRTGQAATLKLKSYDWNFDIVPCFYTKKDDYSGREYHLIPDGDGNWMKTDPKVDQQLVTTLNQVHSGKVLDVIRLVKYWNKRPKMPSAPSYLLESMTLDYFSTAEPNSYNIQHTFADVLKHISLIIHGSVTDPKGIDGDINTLSFDDRQKIYAFACTDSNNAFSALVSEYHDDDYIAVNGWKKIFGLEFPAYG